MILNIKRFQYPENLEDLFEYLSVKRFSVHEVDSALDGIETLNSINLS